MQTQQKTTQHKNSTPQSKLIEVDHTLNVPVARLFEAFRSPQSLKAWWWPQNLFTDKVEIDFREGGRYFMNMRGFEQGGGGMTGEFEEIIENKRIVMTDHFANENGQQISAKEAKMPGDWPETCWITFEFESVGSNKSRVQLSQEGIPNELQKDCIQGWNEMFDKLEKYLSNPQ